VCACAAAALLGLAGAASAATWTTSNGPEGGAVSAVAADAGDARTIFASTESGLYRSTDAGRSWLVTTPEDFGGVVTVAVDPVRPGRVYASTFAGFVRSLDGGTTWRPVGGLDETLVTALAIDRQDPDTIYAAGLELTPTGDVAPVVVHSTDGGASWTPTQGSLDGGTLPAAIALDPLHEGTVYLVTLSGVLKSSDGGRTWAARNVGLDDALFVETLAADPTTGTLYAGGFSFQLGPGDEQPRAVFRSTDGAATWQPASTGLDTSDVSVIAIDPAQPSTIYAGGSGDPLLGAAGAPLYKSIDGGDTWQPEGSGLGQPLLTLAFGAGATVYAGAAEGFFESADAGATWRLEGSRLIASSVFSLAGDPRRRGVVHAGADAGFFTTADGGATWGTPATGIPGGAVAVAVDRLHPSTAYAAAQDGVYRSENGGTRWSRVAGLEQIAGPDALAVDPQRPFTVYVGGSNGVIVTANRGDRWRRSSRGLAHNFVTSLAIDPTTTRTLYAGTLDDHVFKSVDGGTSWHRVDAGRRDRYVTALLVDPFRPSVVYAARSTGIRGSAGGVFRSTDGGGRWRRVSGAIPPDVNVYGLAADPIRHGTLYAATDFGVYVSANRGRRWSPLGEGLGFLAVYSVAVDSSGSVLYAGTGGAGVKSLRLGHGQALRQPRPVAAQLARPRWARNRAVLARAAGALRASAVASLRGGPAA
jgi:photosystem II stability/assembly factor-like uncharacterized protein